MAASVPAPEYSKKEIVAAGRILAERRLPLTNEVAEAFRIAHAWRTAHALPMRRVRNDLKGKVRRSGGTGLTAARIKRMASIRAKLARTPLSLYQIQDLAGVRAIVPDLADVERIASLYHAGESPHAVRREDDYIAAPKPDGYRSRHLVLKFAGTGDEEAYSRQSVEVQLRTRLQHVWSTAVEAVGLAQGVGYKAGEGPEAWRRLFVLMSGAIAEREGALPPPEVPAAARERREELRGLECDLGALAELEAYRQTFDLAERVAAAGSGYFLVRFDRERRRAFVQPYQHLRLGTEAYDRADGYGAGGTDVLIEVDRLQDLKEAFPNYFLDVKEFVDLLREEIAPERQAAATTNGGAPASAGAEFEWIRVWDRLRLRGGRGGRR